MPTSAVTEVVERPYFEVTIAGRIVGSVREDEDAFIAETFNRPLAARVFDTRAQAVHWLTQLHRARERAFVARRRLDDAEFAVKKLELSE